MTRVVLFFLLASVLTCPVQAQDKETNYCRDPESWKEWNEQLKTDPKDIEVQTLYALRLGLCLKVQRGDLTLDEATSIFEQARGALIQKRREENQQKKAAGRQDYSEANRLRELIREKYGR